MISNRQRPDSACSREILVVAALTFMGGVIRLWAPARLGLVHFDEGIYAMAGFWVISPRGFQELESSTAYAPPGFPVLVGLSYLGLGVRDVSAILVSVVTGTLTIPAAAWLGRRTFGKGAGAAAAALTAFSGPHIAFSRMALVDTSFLLAWLIAIGQGQRFLERPNPIRAGLLGLAVGIAQLFKYSGWISGVIVGLTAAVWLCLRIDEWRSTRTLATWVWGAGAALVAAAVYWPWYVFVDSHGGYAALVAHQRGYLGGISSWPGHLYVQLTQAMALSGGPLWPAAGASAAVVALYFSEGRSGTEGSVLPRILTVTAGVTALGLFPLFGWWIVAGWILLGLIPNLSRATPSACMLAAGWVLLCVMTPFYHPYARLWLPVHAFGWLVSGGVVAWVCARIELAGRGRRLGWNPRRDDTLPWLAALCILVAAVFSFTGQDSRWQRRSVRLLAPTDSLRDACRAILSDLPKDVKQLRVFARPPVGFYLSSAGRVGIATQPSVDRLFARPEPSSWAVLDVAMLGQNPIAPDELSRAQTAWVLVGDYRTTLSVPALLDIDPTAARRGTKGAGVQAALRLMRPKRGGDPP